jgi:hypothetical protein
MFDTDNNNNNSSIVTGVVASLALFAVVVYLFYTSKHAQRNRNFVKNIADAVKIEIIERVMAAKKLSHDEYKVIADSIADTYHSIDGITKNEIKSFIDEIKRAKIVTTPKKKTVRKKATSLSVVKKTPKRKSVAKTTLRHVPQKKVKGTTVR